MKNLKLKIFEYLSLEEKIAKNENQKKEKKEQEKSRKNTENMFRIEIYEKEEKVDYENQKLLNS